MVGLRSWDIVSIRVVRELAMQGGWTPDLILAGALSGWPLTLTPPALVRMGRRRSSFGQDCTSARDVKVLTTWHHFEQLSVEKVLVHLVLCFHITDAHIFQPFIVMGGKLAFSFHDFCFHFSGSELNQDSA